MSKVRFTLDDLGPFDGTLRFGTQRETIVAFTALAARPERLAKAERATVTREDGSRFAGRILRITVDSAEQAADLGTLNGYVAIARSE